MYKLLKGSVFFAFVVALAPSITFAQSLEWLAENRGVLPHAVAEAILAPVNVRTNDGLEQKVRSFFADNPIMAEIARCESRFRQFDDAGEPLDGGAGSMIGLFQINAPVHKNFAASIGMDIYTVDGNMAYAQYLHRREGTDPWLSSFSCWHNATATNAPPGGLSQDLYLGVISPEVRALQVMLNAKGYILAETGPGSPGQETDKFGSLTRAAVRKFQCAIMSICSGDEHANGYGMVNAHTRSALLGAAAAASEPRPPSEISAEEERLRNLIAELSAQLFALRQKQGA